MHHNSTHGGGGGPGGGKQVPPPVTHIVHFTQAFLLFAFRFHLGGTHAVMPPWLYTSTNLCYSKISVLNILHIICTLSHYPLRARRALSLFNNVPLRTRRALLLYLFCGDSALLVLNGTSLKQR